MMWSGSGVLAEPLCAVTWRSLLNSVRNTATAMLSIRCVRNSNNVICFPEDDLSFAKITETKIFRNLSADILSELISLATAFFRLLLDDHDVSLGKCIMKDWFRTISQATRGGFPPQKVTPPQLRNQLRLSFSPPNTSQSVVIQKLGCSGGL